MAKTLKDYFPMIQTRKEVLKEIGNKEKLWNIFELWKEEQQEEFLDFCTGARGVKMLYDSFFKEIFSPEYHPERVERILSLLLKRKVKIRQILQNDSVRIAEEQSLLITDMLVELEDGSLANIEIQKLGYAFPGQRVACYSADTLLRQYKRVKSERKKRFTYRDVKNVYTIVFFEKSTQEFQQLKDRYIHRSKQIFDTGLKLDTLQEYILIPLDIFRENMHNKIVENELDAWLSFLSFDEPERIIQLMEAYPEFGAMYAEVYGICCNIESVMQMYSKELAELDRNTVQYMIEEQEKLLKKKQEELAQMDEKLTQKDEQLTQKDEELTQKDEELTQKDEELTQKDEQLTKKDEEIAELKRKLEELLQK